MRNVRYLVLVLIIAACIVVSMNRTNLNIALIPMTATADVPSSGSSSQTAHYGCPAKSKPKNLTLVAEAVAVHDTRSYDWDQRTQGKILGSFFWSYFVFMIPAGMLAEKFGARWILFASLSGSAVVSVATPLITDYHVSVLIVSRCLMGVFQSGFYPATYGLIARWFPLRERSLAFAMSDIGAIVGSVITYLSGGFLIESWGWPYLFWIPAVIALVTSFVFGLGVRSEPSHHPLITDRELCIIFSNDLFSAGEGNPAKRPKTKGKKASPNWIAILTCPSVLATAFFKFACMSCCTFIYLELPKYLSEVIHEDIVDNGSINAFVYIITVITMTVNGALSEYIIAQGFLGRTTTRKVFSVFVGTLSAISLSMIPVVGCDSFYLKVLLCLNAFFNGFTTGADVPIVSEMTKNFPSTLCAFFNMIAMSSGFIIPYFTGVVLDWFPDPTAGWPIVFFTCAAVSVVANVFYLMFAEAERQKFDFIGEEEQPLVDANDVDFVTRRCMTPII